ncbi:Uncharacterized protein APZ42_004792 [Daphnia magna]|uniref:Uncharacterized protein n=1 Tax=Daphnia magna TaxID=35525 RepID=A0A164GUC5_9CRUS|nr:Uncharacterized protein APZ42_004792 [Daphnia magna]
MKKWEGYTLTTFVKIREKRYLLESNEIFPVHSKLNGDFKSNWLFHL